MENNQNENNKTERAKTEKALSGLLPKISDRNLRLLTMLAHELVRKP